MAQLSHPHRPQGAAPRRSTGELLEQASRMIAEDVKLHTEPEGALCKTEQRLVKLLDDESAVAPDPR